MGDGSFTTTDFPDVSAALADEGIAVPEGVHLDSADVWILPTMKLGRPLFRGLAADALKIGCECGIRARLLTADPNPRFIAEKADTLLLPALLVFLHGGMQVPWSVLANYLSALLQVHRSRGPVRSSLYVNDGARTFRFEYEGPASGLIEALRELTRGPNA